MFTIYPAIDIKDGRCVRLRQGRAEDAKVYSEDPVETARRWERAGAEALHVVDLDGAFCGTPVHTEVAGRIVRSVSIPVQLGGGLRTDGDIDAALAAGVRRAIIGTRAIEQGGGNLGEMAKRFGDRLAVSIDARSGRVQVRGWVETTGKPAVDLAREVCESGIHTIIFTDTATDGMLGGPNLRAIAGICKTVSCAVIASGGVSSADDARNLVGLGLPNLAGAIVGKALYEQSVTLAELMAAACEGRKVGR
jgi:phosphoribosylformimino-5-aminoimidazole carboxamide ribotide isomerase